MEFESYTGHPLISAHIGTYDHVSGTQTDEIDITDFVKEIYGTYLNWNKRVFTAGELEEVTGQSFVGKSIRMIFDNPNPHFSNQVDSLLVYLKSPESRFNYRHRIL